MTEKLGIGSTIWKQRDNLGRGATEFEPRKIIGETSRSWLIEPAWAKLKVPKKRPRYCQWCFSEEEVADRKWSFEHRGKIMDAVREADGATLRKVAEVVGYTVLGKEPARG